MEKLLAILSDLHPDIDFETQENLIAEIVDEFDVTITAKDISPANFNSAKALYELICRLEDED